MTLPYSNAETRLAPLDRSGFLFQAGRRSRKEKHSRIRSHLFFSGLYSRFTKRLLRFVYVIIAFYFTIYNPFVKKKCHFFYSK